MHKIEDRFFDIGYMDTLAAGTSSLHALDSRVKLLTTLVFIVTVVSFDKYAFSALIPFILYPLVLIAVGGLPVRYLLKKVLLVLPVTLVIGIFNPLMDREVYFYLGSLGISGGWVSFFSILLRAVLTASAALILISLTGFNAVCLALAKLGVPRPFVVQLLFFYRYIFVLTDEAERLVRARSLRSFNSRAMEFGTFVPLAGHLLLRTLDRAQRIYLAMCCRGFDGHIRIVRSMKVGFKEIVFLVGWILLFVFFRLFNIPEKLGMLVTGVFL